MCGGALEEWCRCQRDRRGKCIFIHVRVHMFEEGTVRVLYTYVCANVSGVCLRYTFLLDIYYLQRC